ncbi:MAG TPA: DUF2059 domain-containing protein [Rhizomicrobium sp.]|jgi:hypothetical protein|nr:DUF2059 domain-containing protein [Rhizomicrobium sp.]
MRLRGFAAVALFAIFATTAGAAPPDDVAARLAAAQDMFAAEHRHEMEEIRIDLVVARAGPSFRASQPGATDADVQRFCALLHEELDRNLTQLLAARAQYYADHFTLAELKDWTAMMRSDIGQKIVAAEPEMMRDMSNVDYEWLKDAMARASARYAQHEGAQPL